MISAKKMFLQLLNYWTDPWIEDQEIEEELKAILGDISVGRLYPETTIYPATTIFPNTKIET